MLSSYLTLSLLFVLLLVFITKSVIVYTQEGQEVLYLLLKKFLWWEHTSKQHLYYLRLLQGKQGLLLILMSSGLKAYDISLQLYKTTFLHRLDCPRIF